MKLLAAGACNIDSALENTQEVHVTFEFGYLQHFFALGDNDAEQHLRVLQAATINSISFLGLSWDEAFRARCVLFWQALGSIPTLTAATIVCREDTIQVVAIAIQKLRHVSALKIVYDGLWRQADGVVDYTCLAGALQDCPRLWSLEYGLPTNSYRAVLSSLQRNTPFSLLLFPAFPEDEGNILDMEDASALTQLITGSRICKLALDGLHILARDAFEAFCSGIEDMATESLSLTNMHVMDGKRFAEAISHSLVADLRVSFWPKARDAVLVDDQRISFWPEAPPDAELSRFLSALALNILAMNYIELLDIHEIYSNPYCSMNAEAVPLLIHSASKSLTLRRLMLPPIPALGPYANVMDDALVCLFGSQISLLESISLTFFTRSGKLQRAEPNFLCALKKNFTLRVYVKFQHLQNVFGDNEEEDKEKRLWGENVQQTVTMLRRLNRWGRNYMLRDANDYNRGFEMLEKAGNDLNCLFFHLRENPPLCWRCGQP
ncbi:hypothetical protein MPSEU_000423100 [Mayamaea pseudoterrestris]|nr:hypothetical protein MPSEU_000423100 [Mayamaea pseudoterrestris]